MGRDARPRPTNDEMKRHDLENMERHTLIVIAERAGVERASVLTRSELVDELILRDGEADDATMRMARGFFGIARDLLASVVERGLHLPEAAERIRQAKMDNADPARRKPPSALPTVTLAEIYAAQGHTARALETVRRVLEREPEHTDARRLVAKLEGAAEPASVRAPESTGEPQGESQPKVAAAESNARRDPEPRHTEKTPERAPQEPAPDHVAHRPSASPARAAEGVAPEVSLRVDEGNVLVAWRWAEPGGSQRAARRIARAVVVTPSWDGVDTATFDVELSGDSGQQRVTAAPIAVSACVALGWLDKGGMFSPLVVRSLENSDPKSAGQAPAPRAPAQRGLRSTL